MAVEAEFRTELQHDVAAPDGKMQLPPAEAEGYSGAANADALPQVSDSATEAVDEQNVIVNPQRASRRQFPSQATVDAIHDLVEETAAAERLSVLHEDTAAEGNDADPNSQEQWFSEDGSAMVNYDVARQWDANAAGGRPGSAAAWRRKAQRRAIRHGASTRNQYLLDARPSTSSPSRPALSPTPAGIEGQDYIEDAFSVWLHVYDLRGTEDTNSAVIGMGIGIFHVGVEIYGVEWSYGYVANSNPSAPPISGVYPVDPCRCPIGTFRESINLGPLQAHSAQDVWRLICSLGSKWLGTKYHPIRHNCHHFCAELCESVGVEGMPNWIGRLAVAADYVLMPVLDALDVPIVPVPEEVTRLSVTETQTGDEVEAVKSQGPAKRTQLSVPTSIALDFEEKFNWALVKMLMCEAQALRELEEGEDELES